MLIHDKKKTFIILLTFIIALNVIFYNDLLFALIYKLWNFVSIMYKKKYYI